MPRVAAACQGVWGISRRGALAWAAPWTWGTLLARLGQAATATPAPPARRPIRACILIFYYGGPSQLDTWDLKPAAPAEIRGEFRPVATPVAGVQISEHLPLTARVMDKVAIVRSVHHAMRGHNSAAYQALVGRAPLRDEVLLTHEPNAFPPYGAALSFLAPRPDVMPSHVALPHVMYNVVELPGQRSGFLGPGFNPLQVTRDPSADDFRLDELSLPPEMTRVRLAQRERLLTWLESWPAADSHAPPDEAAETIGAPLAPRAALLQPYQRRAFELLQSDRVRRAFDLTEESDAARDRYGRHKLGQSVLLARRLVASGVRFVNVNDKVRNSQLANWDSHQDNFTRLKNDLLPPADQAFSALVEDLDARGLLESTLVVALGEFGRTPLVNQRGGRDHWPDCFSIVMAGGGIQGGAVWGASDARGAYPDRDPVSTGDLAATIFWRFGLDPRTLLHDLTDRPLHLAEGTPLEQLFAAG